MLSGSGIPKQESIFIGSDIIGMLEEVQTGMVVFMVVWDLVQEMLRVRGF